MAERSDRDEFSRTGEGRVRRQWPRALGLFVAASLTAARMQGNEPTTNPRPNQEAADAAENSAVAVNAPSTDDLLRLDPDAPIWIDTKQKQVVMQGEICLREGALEMFACPRHTKEHESVLSVPVRPLTVHASLLAVGALPGHPARWAPKFEPAEGTSIEVVVFWQDENGKQQRARAQDWVRQIKTGKAMDQSWVFAGSLVQRSYLADAGAFICVSNFPDAMLDVPVESSEHSGELQFEAFTERIPPRGTKVTLVLAPKPARDAKPVRRSVERQ